MTQDPTTLTESDGIPSRRGGTQVVGNIGMYFAAYRLSMMGWNVMPTARNARGIDLLAYYTSGSRYKGIQVKAVSRELPPIPLGKSVDELMGDWWIIVTNVAAEPVCFIMHPDEVKQLAHRGEKDGKTSCWLRKKEYNLQKFREAWDRIGRGD